MRVRCSMTRGMPTDYNADRVAVRVILKPGISRAEVRRLAKLLREFADPQWTKGRTDEELLSDSGVFMKYDEKYDGTPTLYTG